MRIKIEYYNVLSPYLDEKIDSGRKIVELEYNEGTTIQEILDSSYESCADLSQYYNLSRELCCNNGYFPYIISSNGVVLWEISYRNTKVVDFLYTHRIKDNFIHADTGIPQAGGIGFKEIAELWNLTYPVLDQLGTLLGLAFGVNELRKIIKAKFLSKKVAPQSVFDLILSRDKWNHFELSEFLGLSNDETKQLLQISGFEWDRQKMMYILGEKRNEVIEKLSSIDVFYDGK